MKKLLALLLCAPLVANADLLITDYEGGLPPGHFVYVGVGAVDAATVVASDTSPTARPGQIGNNTFLSVEFNAIDFGGFGQDFQSSPQDWSSFEGINFWFFGQGDGGIYQFEIFDNGTNASDAERWDILFVDNSVGWTQIFVAFADFTRATDFQPPGAVDDGLTLTQMWGYAVVLDRNSGVLGFDDISLTDVLDADGDGVPNGEDNCPSTVIPESVPTRSLGVNHFALVDGDNTFDTTSPRGNGPGRSYTTVHTAGCSCTQIIEAQGLGNGHTKFGCSISAMDDWIELVTP